MCVRQRASDGKALQVFDLGEAGAAQHGRRVLVGANFGARLTPTDVAVMRYKFKNAKLVDGDGCNRELSFKYVYLVGRDVSRGARFSQNC